MNDPMLPLPGLSSVSGKTIVAKFDSGLLSSDGGIMVLREVEQRLRVADRMAACIEDPRAPDQITHTLADIIRFRLLMIAAGYEDGNDASSLRSDPMFKMALDLSPSDRELCSQSTISRLENLPTLAPCCAWAAPWSIFIAGPSGRFPNASRSTSQGECAAFVRDDTFDAVHGGQQLRLFNAHYDEYGFQPIVVFDGEGRFITAALRPAKRPGGKEIEAFLRRLLRAIRANWPKTQIMLRGDSHYCSPEVLDFCRANGLDYILGVAPTTTLRRHIGDLEASVKARYEAAPKQGKARRFREFYDGAASWSRVERVIARVEAGAEGPDTRFVVTNLKKRNARALYEDVYCRRGQAENHIKSWKTHLAADRTSCTKATANQLRLFLHAGAYWLMCVGVDGPRRHRLCQNEVVADLKQRGPSVEQISRIGMDTSKHFFQLHGVNAAEKVVLRKKLRRKEMVAFFKALAPTVIGIEACGASHYWARLLRSFGHEVKLIAPQLVKPYVKRGKNDMADAEALCEAMSRPTMRFVPVKTAEQQAALMMVGLRDRLIRNCTQLSNAIRGYAAEFGLTSRQGYGAPRSAARSHSS